MAAILAKAVCFGEALQPGFAVYARRIVDNAQALAAAIADAGFRIVTGGTDNHLFLVDLRASGLTGREAEQALNAVGVIVNRNTIPNDPQPATVASGLRIGTPALSTRGMGPDEMRVIGKLIGDVLAHPGDAAVEARARDEVAGLTSRFPVPGITTDAAWPLD